ncbi:MAG TPA: hypothetical protein VFU41_06660 [Gemmatimonadales bacterium]|nr:hypothetical protein [Gemmatimonadales bacterium]
MRRLFFGLVVLALAIACGESSGPATPPPRPTARLHFLVQDPNAPPLLTDTASFYAKLGEGREVRMHYQGAAPGQIGEEFLRFEVPDEGLYRRPDGSLFQVGDSILITILIPDLTKFSFEFEPSGLQFNPSKPARLRLKYLHGDHDFDNDGVEGDPDDVEIESDSIDVWRRQPPDTLWFRLGALKLESADELYAEILHFTDHAIAW